MVILAGSAIMATGTITLVIVFRRFGGESAGTASHKRLIGALIAFIFLCCLALFVLSYLEL